VYADLKYDWEQMSKIRKGLEKPTKQKRLNWKSLVNQLQREAEDGIDSLYKQTDAGSKLESIQQEVENALGIWLEPSIQAGRGGIWFYSSEDDSTLASNYDYQTFNEDTIDMAIESKNKTEFKKRYQDYLENILNGDEDYKEAIAFAEKHKDEVVSYINDTTDLGDEDFEDECIDKMIDMLEKQGLYVSDDVESYLVDMFERY